LPGKVYIKPFVKNIADALDADYKELYALIEDSSLGEKFESETLQSKNKFDYRWLVVSLMVALIALIIFLLKPLNNEIKEQTEKTIQIEDANKKKQSKRKNQFSSELDFFHDGDKTIAIHNLEITAVDSVWLLLISRDDTLYAGTLVPGRIIKDNQAKLHKPV